MKLPTFVSLVFFAVLLHAQDFQYLPTSTTNQIVTHSHYALSYSEDHEQAEWVAYELTATEAQGTIDRTDNFRPDPSVSTGSAALSDYKGSGYDRGHLAPAADMAFSPQAMSESFYLSNMSPQTASFNRGIWRQVEQQVRTWAVQNNSVYVVTGCIFTGRTKSVGYNRVAVPTFYYKVIADLHEPEVKATALLLSHRKGTTPLSQYAVTIDSIDSRRFLSAITGFIGRGVGEQHSNPPMDVGNDNHETKPVICSG